jgi:hypothetical protein
MILLVDRRAFYSNQAFFHQENPASCLRHDFIRQRRAG